MQTKRSTSTTAAAVPEFELSASKLRQLKDTHTRTNTSTDSVTKVKTGSISPNLSIGIVPPSVLRSSSGAATVTGPPVTGPPVTAPSATVLKSVLTKSSASSARKEKILLPKSADVERECGGDGGSHNSMVSLDDSSMSNSLVSIKTGCLGLTCVGNTTATNRMQIIQMLFLPFIPIVALVIQNSTLLSSVVFALSEAHEIQHQVNLTVEATTIIQALQTERGATAFYIFTQGNKNILSRERLQDRFTETDMIIRNTTVFLDHHVLRGKTTFSQHLRVLGTRRNKILNLTSSSNTTEADDLALDEMIWYNVANDLILDQLSQRIRETSTTGVWKTLIAYKNIIRSIENYSISMVYGLYYYGKGTLSGKSFIKFVKYDSLAEDYLNATQSFSLDILRDYEHFGKAFDFYDELENRRQRIYEKRTIEPNAADAEDYYKKMNLYINELRGYQFKLRDTIIKRVADEITEARGKQALAAALLTIVLCISPIILFLIKSITKTIQLYAAGLSRRTVALRREQKKSDRLLSQMLPPSVVKQLRQKKQVPAEMFQAVTIYFSDIVSFTKLSSASSPMEIVIMLNSLYKLFDSRIEHYDVYKVETIGDAYMVVSGLPERNGSKHASEICTMALDLIAGVQSFQIPHRPGEKLQIRVGVNSGPCVAGVVGTKMPRYCLFGDSINTASRMESTGEPMRIHITQDTKTYLDEIGGFITQMRGYVDIKGKGNMTTYWLEGLERGLPRSVEVSTPGFFAEDQVIQQGPYVPEFFKEIFGSEDDDLDMPFEGLTLTTLHPSSASGGTGAASQRSASVSTAGSIPAHPPQMTLTSALKNKMSK